MTDTRNKGVTKKRTREWDRVKQTDKAKKDEKFTLND